MDSGHEHDLLRAGQIHLWLTKVDDLRLDSELAAAYRAMLSEPERHRLTRFRFPDDQRRYLVSRALLRTTLSRYSNGFSPAEWHFGASYYGKPYIVHPQPSVRRLRFNLSHAGAWAVVAIAYHRRVGIDVEATSPPRSVNAQLIAQTFSPAEHADVLRQAGEEAQRARFYAYWTLKEAFIKARGQGLSLPLNRFGFDLSQPRHARLYMDEACGPAFRRSMTEDGFSHQQDRRPLPWRTWQWACPDAAHILALCVHDSPRHAQAISGVKVRCTMPLRDKWPCALELLRSGGPAH